MNLFILRTGIVGAPSILPTVTAISPVGGGLAGGTVVFVTGTGFSNVTSVNFGATPATSFSVVNANLLTCVAPALSAGARDITATNSFTTSATSAADLFTSYVFPANLIGYWTLSDGTDFTGNNSMSNVGGGPTYVAGLIGNCASFDYTANYLSHANVAAFRFGTADFSINFWMNPVAWTSTAAIMGQKASDGTAGWQIYRDGASNRLTMRGVQGDFNPTTEPSTGVWQMYTFVRSSGTQYWYRNGAQNCTPTSGTANITDSSATFNIGFGQTWSATYNGKLDEIGIWNRALTTTEITSLYNSGNGLNR